MEIEDLFLEILNIDAQKGCKPNLAHGLTTSARSFNTSLLFWILICFLDTLILVKFYLITTHL